MLRDDIARFTELSGEDGKHTSIQRIGSYLDGYDRAISDIRKLEDVVYMHIDSLEGTRNIVEAGMLSAWKEVAEYVDGMLGEDGEE